MKRFGVLLLLLAVPFAHAHDLRHHEAHVHGQATVDIALERGTLELMMRAPGIGILDFERAPATAGERAALATALSTLKRGGWVTLPTAAQCTLTHSEASAEGFQPTATAAQAGQHAHAGFSATLRFQCANSNALRVAVVTLPTLFPGLHEVVVNSATSAGQSRSVLTPGNLRVLLAP